jgi:hypothetical protein
LVSHLFITSWPCSLRSWRQPHLQKTCASSCWKRRTRVSPWRAPLYSLRCSTPKSASRSGSSRYDRVRLPNIRQCPAPTHAAASQPAMSIFCGASLCIFQTHQQLQAIATSTNAHLASGNIRHIPVRLCNLNLQLLHTRQDSYADNLRTTYPIEDSNRRGWFEAADITALLPRVNTAVQCSNVVEILRKIGCAPGQFMGLSPNSCFSMLMRNMFSL